MQDCSYTTMYLINKYEREILDKCTNKKMEIKTNSLPAMSNLQTNNDDHDDTISKINTESNTTSNIPNLEVKNNGNTDETVVAPIITSTPISEKSISMRKKLKTKIKFPRD